MNKIALKICGITDIKSVITAHKNKIKSLEFASNNLDGPNTANDKKINYLIKECNYYKIESVLLSRYQSTLELVKQIDYTKPKIIACSYFFDKSELLLLKKIFKKLKIGISSNPKRFDKNYFQSVASLTNIFYYDLNIYEKDDIKTFSIYDCLDQINFLRKLKKPIYIGGSISHKNAKVVINNAHPHGLDISRSLKDGKNDLCEKKLNRLIQSLSVG